MANVSVFWPVIGPSSGRNLFPHASLCTTFYEWGAFLKQVTVLCCWALCKPSQALLANTASCVVGRMYSQNLPRLIGVTPITSVAPTPRMGLKSIPRS